jgi:hypothetical protein
MMHGIKSGMMSSIPRNGNPSDSVSPAASRVADPLSRSQSLLNLFQETKHKIMATPNND